MTSGSLYNLTWGEYGTSLISAVQLLRCHDELVDVTLAAGGRTFHAHKVVLCAASPFLLDLLKSTSCKHPVVMLAGVQACDLEALLEFVYRGEVSVDPNQLPSLLQAAHCLNIQGLSPSTIAVNSNSLQPNVKHEIVRTSEVPQTTAFLADTPPEASACKRKRRLKRTSTSPTSKVFVTEANENVLLQNQDEDGSSNSWGQHTQAEPQPVPAQILPQSMPVPVGISAQAQKRGASDQPGSCPLCGAMLRQARNLRRHLITSCKYRMMNSLQTTTGSTQVSAHEVVIDQQPQEYKPEVVVQQQTQTDQQPLDVQALNADISCNNLLPTTSSLLSM